MKKGSWLNQIKRKAMREAGLTFQQRVSASLGSGKAPAGVMFKKEGKQIVAVPK